MELVEQEFCSGHAYLELLIALPFLLLVGLSGFELTRFMSASQAASIISREVAATAYRCAAQQETLSECLKERRADVDQFAANVFPQAKTRVSVYRWLGSRTQCDDEDPAAGGNITGALQLAGTFGAENFPSRFGFENGQTTGAVETLRGGGNDIAWSSCMNGFLVIGEAEIAYRPSISFDAGTTRALAGGVFYDATIL